MILFSLSVFASCELLEGNDECFAECNTPQEVNNAYNYYYINQNISIDQSNARLQGDLNLFGGYVGCARILGKVIVSGNSGIDKYNFESFLRMKYFHFRQKPECFRVSADYNLSAFNLSECRSNIVSDFVFEWNNGGKQSAIKRYLHRNVFDRKIICLKTNDLNGSLW